MQKIFIKSIMFSILIYASGCKNNSSGNNSRSIDNRLGTPAQCLENQSYNDEKKKCVEICDSNKKYDENSNSCIPVKTITPINEDQSSKRKQCLGNSYFDEEKDDCVPGLPLIFLNQNESILPEWASNSKFTICVDVDDEVKESLDENFYYEVADNIKLALRSWTAPLLENNYTHIKQNKIISVIKSANAKCIRNNWNAVVHISSDQSLKKVCGIGTACADAGSRQVWVSPSHKFDTYLHEFGHIFGFEDHYVKNGTRFCKDGYDVNTTVMCYSGNYLFPADIDGMKRQYCRFWPESEECNKKELNSLLDISNGTMLECDIKSLSTKIRIVNNYTNVDMIISQSSQSEKSIKLKNLLFNSSLRSSIWKIQDTRNDDLLFFELDWDNKKLQMEYKDGIERKLIHLDLSNQIQELNNDNSIQKGSCKILDPLLSTKFTM